MCKRRLLLGVVVLALLATCGMAVWLTLPKPGITRANYERIHEGMTRAEVEAVTGRKADYHWAVEPFATVAAPRLMHIWLEGEGFFDEGTTYLTVEFRPDFTVRSVSFHEPPLSYRLRRLLPW